MCKHVLYISYDGILEPLGQSQVLRYLERLAVTRKIFLISFEKEEDWADVEARDTQRAKLAKTGIKWHPLRYHKRPSGIATAFDVFMGISLGLWLCLRHQIRIVHARSYVPSVMALVLKRVLGVKYVFDMRGFWADERVDGGLWPKAGRMYRVAKWFERKFLLNADCVVSLTQAAVDEMKTFSYLQGAMARFEVITTCTDLDRFTIEGVDKNNNIQPKPFILGYVGSVGVWYLFDETLRCFKLLLNQKSDAILHILNRGEQDFIREKLNEFEIPTSSVYLESADHAGVARAMQRMDAGIFFIKPVYSKMASAPTKLGEFLGCGVPCLANSGVGDMASIIESENVGVAVADFTDAALLKGISDLMLLIGETDVRMRCRRAADRHFSLEHGVQSYHQIYQTLSRTNP